MPLVIIERAGAMPPALDQPWTLRSEAALAALTARPEGLTATEAAARLERYGPNVLRAKRGRSGIAILLAQFSSPLVLILIAAAVLSLFLHDPIDATIILIIVLASGFLGFWQERGAQNAVDSLISMVQVRANVRRDGTAVELAMESVVPGDIVELSAGAMVPADGLVLEATALFVDAAALTGETLPVEKAPGALPADTALAGRTNALFMGTHVVSGYGLMLVAATGRATEFGAISERLRLRPPETEFERGLRRLGNMLMRVTLVMLSVIFGLNVFLDRPVIDAFLFALALAVGITPQLLPTIVTINLSRGARRMAAAHVIVKRYSRLRTSGAWTCSVPTRPER